MTDGPVPLGGRRVLTYQGYNSDNAGPKPNPARQIATRNCAVAIGFNCRQRSSAVKSGTMLGGIALTTSGGARILSEPTKNRPGFATSLVLGIIAVAIGIFVGVLSGAVWWGVAFAVFGVAWIVYAIRQRREARR